MHKIKVVLYLHSTSNHNLRMLPPLNTTCCIISSFYIKPQLQLVKAYLHLSCIISSFYIKPQLFTSDVIPNFCCIISSFYIKPQPSEECWRPIGVVLYLHSTSNHNTPCRGSWLITLYYIFILHQTTTEKMM